MKRIALLLPLVAGLAMPIEGPQAKPMAAFSGSVAPVACEVTEPIAIGLPWSTVSQVLEAVTDVRPYSYSQLVDWYQVGRVTVEQVGSGYRVTVIDDDGLGDILLISNL